MHQMRIGKTDPNALAHALGVRVVDCISFLTEVKKRAPRLWLFVISSQAYFNLMRAEPDSSDEHNVRLTGNTSFTSIHGNGWIIIPEGSISNRVRAQRHAKLWPNGMIVPDGRVQATMAQLMVPAYQQARIRWVQR